MHPPVETDFFTPDGRDPSSAFLIVSALVPYKRLDVAIAACRRVGRRLRIVGTGPELARLRELGGSEVEFLGWRSDQEIRTLYRQSAATLLPGVEDFGIAPVESQACGCPVVALDAGGARETVLDGVTGILAGESTVDAFADALSRLDATRFDEAVVRANALRFSRQQFLNRFRRAVDDALSGVVEPVGARGPLDQQGDAPPAASPAPPRPQVRPARS